MSYSRLSSLACETTDCMNPQQRIKKINRVIINKNAKHNIKERSRTLHKFTLSEGLLNKRELHKIVAHIRQLKSLKHLNIDLIWLQACYQRNGLKKFAETLKHLKSLSTLYFYISSSSSITLLSPGLLCLIRVFGRCFGSSRMEIQLSLMIESRVTLNYIRVFEGFSKLRNFASVHITCANIHIERIPEMFSALKISKSLSRVSIALSESDCCSSDLELQNFFTSLKEMKSVRYFRIYACGSSFINSSQFRKLRPILKKIVQVANLEMVFSHFGGFETGFTRIGQYLLNRSIGGNRSSSFTFRIRFVASFIPSVNYFWVGLFLLILYGIRSLGMISFIPFPVLSGLLNAFWVLILADVIICNSGLLLKSKLDQGTGGKKVVRDKKTMKSSQLSGNIRRIRNN